MLFSRPRAFRPGAFRPRALAASAVILAFGLHGAPAGAAHADAQQPPAASTPPLSPQTASPQAATPQTATPQAAPPQRPRVQSPVIDAGRVTFSVYAPKAAAVTLNSGEINRLVPGPHAFTRGADGVWSVSVGPLPPAIYDYSFDIDGVVMTDPESPDVFGNRRGARGFVEVPGPAGKPRRDEWQSVPHGAVTAHWYDSKTTGTRRRVHVYTPPGYESDATRRYPVLFLLHGSGDNDSHWTLLGRANVIADNLIASRAAQPLIIVMPDGHPYTAPPATPRDVARRTAAERFESDLLTDVVPLVERTYRIERGRDARAIAGLSMGGGQALYVGLRHTDRIAWIGGFSSSAQTLDHVLPDVRKQASNINANARLVWIRIGTDDFLLAQNRTFIDELKSAGIRHEYVETEGAHMWGVWRGYLADLLPRLFQKGPKTQAAR